MMSINVSGPPLTIGGAMYAFGTHPNQNLSLDMFAHLSLQEILGST